jgi:preprotein translocase subunit SecG
MCGLDYKQFLFITIIIIIIIIIKVLLNSETLKMEGLGK